MCLHVVDSDDYYVHAMEGTRIARAILGLNSPMLYIFLHTFGEMVITFSVVFHITIHFSSLIYWLNKKN